MRGKASRVRKIEESWNLWYITGSGRHFLAPTRDGASLLGSPSGDTKPTRI
jgi:hypothetical protein